MLVFDNCRILKHCHPKITSSLFQNPDANKSKQKWITDFAMMTNTNRFILSTGDRELQFFEASTFEPYCQIR